MPVFAAVMTGKGTGAIATIQLYGDSAEDILKRLFIPTAKKQPEFATGQILLGTISTGNKTIDQVTIGCEAPGTFAINCHGNPLIVEQIMQLLQQQDVELITVEQLFCKTSAEDNTIALEAELTLPNAKTIEGTKIILNQIDSGLTATAKNWLENPPDTIAAEAKKIIDASHIAGLLIFGCKIVIAGPPNTGKSTLLNRLCGRDKAITTSLRGTTRDWVSADCRIACGERSRTGPLAVELIDTAGLDETLAGNDIDKAAQQAAVELIEEAELVLLVLDNSESAGQLTPGLVEKLVGKKNLTILNKSDLPNHLDPPKLPAPASCCRKTAAGVASSAVQISALVGTGIDTLCEQILQLAGVTGFDPRQPVCFTRRQERILTQLTKADSQNNAKAIITELLSGPLNV